MSVTNNNSRGTTANTRNDNDDRDATSNMGTAAGAAGAAMGAASAGSTAALQLAYQALADKQIKEQLLMSMKNSAIEHAQRMSLKEVESAKTQTDMFNNL
ncbi:MAG: hypothetical protein AAF183_20045 [Pseudomonadota bacterium]